MQEEEKLILVTSEDEIRPGVIVIVKNCTRYYRLAGVKSSVCGRTHRYIIIKYIGLDKWLIDEKETSAPTWEVWPMHPLDSAREKHKNVQCFITPIREKRCFKVDVGNTEELPYESKIKKPAKV